MQRHCLKSLWFTTVLLCNGASVYACETQENMYPTNPSLLSISEALALDRCITTLLNTSDLDIAFTELKSEFDDFLAYRQVLLLLANRVQEKINTETEECTRLRMYLYFEGLGAVFCPYMVYSCARDLLQRPEYDEASKWKWLSAFSRAYTAKQNLDGVVYGTIGALGLPVFIKLTYDEKNSHEEQLATLTTLHKRIQQELGVLLILGSIELQ